MSIFQATWAIDLAGRPVLEPAALLYTFNTSKRLLPKRVTVVSHRLRDAFARASEKREEVASSRAIFREPWFLEGEYRQRSNVSVRDEEANQSSNECSRIGVLPENSATGNRVNNAEKIRGCEHGPLGGAHGLSVLIYAGEQLLHLKIGG